MAGFAAKKEGERQGDFVGGKYLLEECLGIGGMGEVYRATNVSLGRKVAIKLLNKEHTSNEDDVLRFLREARAVAAVRHPNVVDVFDVARDDDGTPFIVQELLSGEDLEQFLGSDRSVDAQLPVAEALEIMIPVAEAVAAAHAHDVVHRDLKPANIYLAREGNRIVPKVLDFGACLYQTVGGLSAKEKRMLIGTPHYMAPEQITTAKDVDRRADVWALGVILYEMLAGDTPFEAADANAVMKRVRTLDVPRLRTLAPDVPQALEDLVHRCLDRDREKRFADAATLGKALEAIKAQISRPASAKSRAALIVTPAPADARPRGRKIDDRIEIDDTPLPPPSSASSRTPSLVLKGKTLAKRRGVSLLSLSAPDDDVSWDDAPRSASRPIEAAKPVRTAADVLREAEAAPRARSSRPPVAPRELDLDHLDAPGEDLEVGLAHQGNTPSSMPPVLDPRRVAPEPRAASEARQPSDPGESLERPMSQQSLAVQRGPRVSGASAPLPPAVWTPRAKATLGAVVVVPALLAFVAFRHATLVTEPLGHAMRGDSPLGSGALAVLALLSASALASRALGTSRSNAMVVATIGAVLMGITMIIVTFSASEAAELELPPAAAGIVPLVAPIVPLALGWLAFTRARAVWLSRYEGRERALFVALAGLLLFAALELGPVGAVRDAGRAVTAPASTPAPATHK